MSDKSAADLLLADLQHFGESLWRNEEIGAKRFNFFLTLVTAVLAGVVATHTSSQLAPKDLTVLRRLSSVAVLVLGAWTFSRMVKRDRVTDEHKATLEYLRRLLASQLSPPMPEYRVPHRPKTHPDQRRARRWRPSGGLAETVAIVNALICMLMAASFGTDWGWALILAVVVLGIQLMWTSRREAPAVHPDQHFRAGVGAVVLDATGRVLAFPRAGAKEWQLPQGGLLVGEEPEVAMWRELGEETGLTRDDLELLCRYPRPLGYELPADRRSAKNGRGQIHVWFFLRPKRSELRCEGTEGGELGVPEWVSFDVLIQRVVEFKRGVYQELQKFYSAGVLDRDKVGTASMPE